MSAGLVIQEDLKVVPETGSSFRRPAPICREKNR